MFLSLHLRFGLRLPFRCGEGAADRVACRCGWEHLVGPLSGHSGARKGQLGLLRVLPPCALLGFVGLLCQPITDMIISLLSACSGPKPLLGPVFLIVCPSQGCLVSICRSPRHRSRCWDSFVDGARTFILRELRQYSSGGADTSHSE